MKKCTYLLFAMIIVINIYGQNSKKKKTTEKQKQNTQLTQEKPDKEGPTLEQLLATAKEFKEVNETGTLNWTEQFIEASGSSVIDTIRFKNKAQARAMAIRGAIVIAQRNLLETINGVKITGETTVENLIATNDYVYSRVEGIIKGATMVGEPREEYGMMVVTMQAPMYKTSGLAPAVIDAIPLKSGSELTPGSASNPGNILAGDDPAFIFNMAGKVFDPSLFPMIVDEEGNIILDLSKIYDKNKGDFPKILQLSKQILQEMNVKKGVEIIDVMDAFDGKIVVNKEIKKKINWDKVAKTIGSIGKILLMFA